MKDEFYKAVPKLKLRAASLRRLRQRRPRSRAPRQVPLSNNGGANAISVSEHALMLMLTVASQGDLAARQRVRAGAGAATARRRACTSCTTRRSASSASAPSARRSRGWRSRSACMHPVLRHRAPFRGRGGPPRRQVPAAARAAEDVRRRVAARAAQRLHAPHDRQGRARADEAARDHHQHLARAGDRREGAARAPRRRARSSARASTCSTRSRRRSNNPLFNLDNVVLTAHFAGPTWTITSRASAMPSTTCSASRAASRRFGWCRNCSDRGRPSRIPQGRPTALTGSRIAALHNPLDVVQSGLRGMIVIWTVMVS